MRITEELETLIALALQEDIGPGDVTSLACVPEGQKGEALIFAKQAGVLFGVDAARCVLRLLDPAARMTLLARDGADLEPGAGIATVRGSLRSILGAERLMLNFLQRLSGVATLTRKYVDALRGAGSAMQVCDTRKTTPLWRALERGAVRAGGGLNHRFALYDMYLIKNNHADAAGGVGEALRRARADNRKRRLPIAVEARDLREVAEILEQGADLLLLDNMTPAQMRQAAKMADGRVQTEITGGVRLNRLAQIARLPIDRVSIGALTHSAPALDISLHIQAVGRVPRQSSKQHL